MLTEQNGIQVDKFYPPTDWQYSFPEGYTRLEYLESTGTQYIDTGYVPNGNTTFNLIYEKTANGSFKYGSRTSANSNAFSEFIGSGGGGGRIDYGTTYNVGTFTNINGTKIEEKTYIENNVYYWQIKYDNVIESFNTAVQIFNSPGSLYLFNMNNNGVPFSTSAYLKVYLFLISDNDVLVRNLVPVKRNSDGVLGMYDLVNNVFYINANTSNTTPFIAGPELYSNNSQIDIRQKNNTNFVEKYKFNANNELVWANPQLNLSGKVNYEKVGDVVIQDGIASNFYNSRYLPLQKPFILNANTVAEFKFKIKLSSINVTSGIIGVPNSYGFHFIVTADNKLTLYIGNGSSWNILSAQKGTTTLSLNIDYYIKININRNNIICSLSTDDINYNIEFNVNITLNEEYSYNVVYGRTRANGQYLQGSIDLKETYIKVNDKLWFYGKNYTSENYAPVPAGLNYNNTTTPSIGYVNTQTQVFTPAPTDGIKYSQTRDIKVIPPEDNTIILLYGVASDFSKYALFGLLASVSSGTYDIYIDDVLYATTASATQTDIDFSTLGNEYVSIGTCTTPEELVLHKIVIKPTTIGETITRFFCRRTTGATGTQQQGILWANLQLENDLTLGNCFGTETAYNNRILYAVTAKNNKIIVTSTSANTTGLYSIYARCSSLVYSPILEYSTKDYINGVYLTFDQTKLKRITIKNNPSIDMTIIRNAQQLEKIDIENPISLRSGTAAGNSAQNAYKLELFPKYETETRTCDNINMYSATTLYPTKINDSTNKLREFLRMYGSSTYPMRGLRGLKVSNEAPFTGTSPQINVSYTGLGRDELVELFESMPGFMPLLVIGSPTISDGVVSGFSSSNYLNISQPFVLNQNTVAEFSFKVNISEIGSPIGIFATLENYGISFLVGSNGKLRLYIGNNSTWNILNNIEVSGTLSINTDYWLKLLINKGHISVLISTDGITYTTTYNTNKTISETYTYNLNIGIGRQPTQYFKGSINIYNSYIIINNARYQFQLPDDTTTRAIDITAAAGNNLTKVGNVVIDTNGVASGFSDSDYLNVVGNINLSSNFKIQIKITPSSVTTGSKKFLSIFYTNSIYLDFYTSGTTPRIDCQYSGSSYWTSIASNLSYDIPIVITISGNGKNLNVETNQNNISQSSSKTLQELGIANIVANNIYLGRGHSTSLPMANGSIDLENTYIKVDQNYLMKGYLLDSDRLIATNKGWTIIG